MSEELNLNDESLNYEDVMAEVIANNYVEPTEPDYSFIGEPEDLQKYVMIFADGSVLNDVWINGDYYVTTEMVTDDILSEENLYEVVIRSNGHEEILYNLEKIDLHQFEGKYWFIIREASVKDLQYEELSAKIDYIAMMGGWEV